LEVATKENMAGRPPGKKSCTDCAVKKRKCSHTSIDLKRSIDSIVVEDNLAKKLKISQKQKKARAGRKSLHVAPVRDRITSHNPTGYNQYSTKEVENLKENFSSPEVFQFSLGKSDLNSKKEIKIRNFAIKALKETTLRAF
jgi:hypothetical protein